MRSTWNIRYYRWAIDDGEPELEVGETFGQFYLAFGSTDQLRLTTKCMESAIEGPDYSYNVTGKVVYVTAAAIVIDFGLKAFGTSRFLPSSTRAGDYVAGPIALSFSHWVDPTSDSIRELMVRRWSVEAVFADLT